MFWDELGHHSPIFPKFGLEPASIPDVTPNVLVEDTPVHADTHRIDINFLTDYLVFPVQFWWGKGKSLTTVPITSSCQYNTLPKVT